MLVLLAGCPICELDTTLDVVEGTTTLRPGEQITLELASEGYYAGPERCRGHWYVDGIEGGNPDVGIVTRCGVYLSTPSTARPREVIVEAMQYPLGTCLDCCPYELRRIALID